MQRFRGLIAKKKEKHQHADVEMLGAQLCLWCRKVSKISRGGGISAWSTNSYNEVISSLERYPDCPGCAILQQLWEELSMEKSRALYLTPVKKTKAGHLDISYFHCQVLISSLYGTLADYVFEHMLT
jgi:hypothetical protein